MPNALKVLLAEDEPAMLNLLSRHMKNLGYEVLEASEGDVAWQLAQKASPDLVVLDVMMPGMSGWEICKRVKATKALAKTGVIMLTGIGENLNDMTSSLFAADAWLNKPFEFAELDQKIASTLRQLGKGAPAKKKAAAVKKKAAPAKKKAAPAKKKAAPVRRAKV